MRVLLCSPAFPPRIGGLEHAVAALAEDLTTLGAEVVVVTGTPSDGVERAPYRIVRRPGALELLRLVRWCEVYYQANVSLRTWWPLLLVRRPWVVAHHNWYRRPDGSQGWRDRLKLRLLRRAAASISVSRAIAAALATPSTVIPNAYREDLFRRLPDVPRDRDLIFVGRLVSDKGLDVLLDALQGLAHRDLHPGLSIVGSGPEEATLRRRCRELELGARVEFLGERTPEDLVRILNRHRILVVPSRWEEPFGIVALEALACGCAVVGSALGGLPEAMGPSGVTFPNGDAGALADALASTLALPQTTSSMSPPVEEHLAAHRRLTVARRHLEVLRAVVGAAVVKAETPE
ncbi:MAG TPA: glycosyltransferase family 4 protein [Thermoanaerobaculia bacterium]|nr:glycosyltransferase family 4 protein [Thermoanaerobaculia bacterium]